MKVLLLNDLLIKGGKERRIVELLKYCNQHFDISIEIILMHKKVDYPEIYELNYPVHIINWSNRKSWEGYKKILAITKKFQPDIIHSWSSMTDIISVALKLNTSKKFISSMIAETLPIRSFRNKEYLRSKISFPFADVVTSNTKAGLESYKAPHSKSVCIYNGFNYNRINHLKNPEVLKEKLGIQNKFIVGMVGAFAPRKDYETFLIAARSILEKCQGEIAFILIGDGPLMENMKTLAGNYVPKDILFTGMINEVEDYIDTFNVGVLCTNSNLHGEGISNAIMECMALAKPVIATEGGGTAEIVLNLKTGYLIPYKGSQILKEKILYLKDHPSVALNMGLLGRQQIKSYFTIESMCNSFHEIYLNLSKKVKSLQP